VNEIREIRNQINQIETLGDLLLVLVMIVGFFFVTGFVGWIVSMILHIIIFGPHSYPDHRMGVYLTWITPLLSPFIAGATIVFWDQIEDLWAGLMSIKINSSRFTREEKFRNAIREREKRIVNDLRSIQRYREILKEL